MRFCVGAFNVCIMVTIGRLHKGTHQSGSASADLQESIANRDIALYFCDARKSLDSMRQFHLVVSARIHESMVALAVETPVVDGAIGTRIGAPCEAMLVPCLYPANQNFAAGHWCKRISAAKASGMRI